MRRKNTISLYDALREYMKEMGIESKLREVDIINSWENIAGKAISSRTSKIYIRDGVMYIYLTSSVVRNELMMMRETIVLRINELAGEDLVKSIVLR